MVDLLLDFRSNKIPFQFCIIVSKIIKDNLRIENVKEIKDKL